MSSFCNFVSNKLNVNLYAPFIERKDISPLWIKTLVNKFSFDNATATFWQNQEWHVKTAGRSAGRNKVSGKTYWVPKSLVKSLRRNRIVSWSWSLSPKIFINYKGEKYNSKWRNQAGGTLIKWPNMRYSNIRYSWHDALRTASLLWHSCHKCTPPV